MTFRSLGVVHGSCAPTRNHFSLLLLLSLLAASCAFLTRHHRSLINSYTRIEQEKWICGRVGSSIFLASSSNDTPKPLLTEEQQNDLEMFLSQGARKWQGTRDILARRKQIKSPLLQPRDVVSLVLKALQANDDPQLDHGACVCLEFASKDSDLSKLDPAQFGRFLRKEYPQLLEFKTADLVGEPLAQKNTLALRQTVRVEGWAYGSHPGVTNFDFYLSYDEAISCWTIDLILLQRT